MLFVKETLLFKLIKSLLLTWIFIDEFPIPLAPFSAFSFHLHTISAPYIETIDAKTGISFNSNVFYQSSLKQLGNEIGSECQETLKRTLELSNRT